MSTQDFLAVVLVAALLTAGCSDSTGSPPSAATEVGPLSAILDETSEIFGTDYYATKVVESENLIAACMAAEGFDYLPMDYSDTPTSTDLDDLTRQNTREWMAQNGYGIALALDMPVRTVVDPNAEYVAALSDAETEAYWNALRGTGNDATFEDETSSHLDVLAGGGCWGAAEREVHRDRDALQGPLFDDLTEAVQQLYLSIAQDPRMLEVSARWADCMADAGYTGLANPEEAVASIVDAQGSLEATGTATAEGRRLADGAVAAFRELEIGTALADFGCKEDVGWDTVHSEVTLELETVFVNDHKALLDDYRAAAETARQSIG